MTTHRTDVCVLFEASPDPVLVPREQRSPTAVADRGLDLDLSADLDVRSTGHPAELGPSAYVDYDAIDTLVRFIGHPVEGRA